jgi:hypothetical protein
MRQQGFPEGTPAGNSGLELAFEIRSHRRRTDIRVDLDAGDRAYAHRFESAGKVQNVRWNDEPTSGDLLANKLGFNVFAFGDKAHRVGDLTATRKLQLRACLHG